MTTHTFGAWCRSARRARGLTQEALADRAGVARPTVQRIEAGRTQPARTTVLLLEQALGVARPPPAVDLAAQVEQAEQADEIHALLGDLVATHGPAGPLSAVARVRLLVEEYAEMESYLAELAGGGHP